MLIDKYFGVCCFVAAISSILMSLFTKDTVSIGWMLNATLWIGITEIASIRRLIERNQHDARRKGGTFIPPQ